MTFDVLSELLGSHNLHVIRNITQFAISNAFYEQIYLYYGLEKLSPWFAGASRPEELTAEEIFWKPMWLQSKRTSLEMERGIKKFEIGY